jgi:hypothetical protein
MGFIRLGPGGLLDRECVWLMEGLRERPSGVDGNGPVGVMGRPSAVIGAWGIRCICGPRMPGWPTRGPFCCGRGLTGLVERQVRGTTPWRERSRRMQRAWEC